MKAQRFDKTLIVFERIHRFQNGFILDCRTSRKWVFVSNRLCVGSFSMDINTGKVVWQNHGLHFWQFTNGRTAEFSNSLLGEMCSKVCRKNAPVACSAPEFLGRQRKITRVSSLQTNTVKDKNIEPGDDVNTAKFTSTRVLQNSLQGLTSEAGLENSVLETKSWWYAVINHVDSEVRPSNEFCNKIHIFGCGIQYAYIGGHEVRKHIFKRPRSHRVKIVQLCEKVEHI